LKIYKIIPAGIYKATSHMMQGLVEPDRRMYKATFKAMLLAKNAKYLKRTAAMIMEWIRKTNTKDIIQIHGSNDHTLPFRCIKKPSFIIKNGSHMMTLTTFAEIQKVLDLVLKN
jgi:hypothetical protein